MRNNRIDLLFSALPLLCLAAFGVIQTVPDSVLGNLFAIFSDDGKIENVPRARAFLTDLVMFLSASFAWLWVAFFSKIAIVGKPDTRRSLKVAAVSSFAVATVSISGYLLHKIGFSMPLIYRKEGLLEIVSALFFIGAAVQFTRFSFSTMQQRLDPTYPCLPVFFILAAVASFFIGMEEISWGQHYLRFDTPEWVDSRNYQSELNLHNFLPQNALDIATILFFWILFIGVAVLNFSKQFPSGPFWDKIRPDANLLGLSILAAVTASTLHADPAEFLLSLAAVYYAFALNQRLHKNNAAVAV